MNNWPKANPQIDGENDRLLVPMGSCSTTGRAMNYETNQWGEQQSLPLKQMHKRQTMNAFLCRWGVIAEPAGGGRDLDVSRDARASMGGDPGIGD
jgi:hypothetical protein